MICILIVCYSSILKKLVKLMISQFEKLFTIHGYTIFEGTLM